jgi:biopolymer transport protein ExbD
VRPLRLPRRRAPPSIDATLALINIAFLLMAFFMLIGRMDATAPFEVVPPLSDAGTTLPQGGITIAVAGDGRLALEGAPASMAEIVGRLRGSDPSPDMVRINADATAALGSVLPLASALESAGATRIVLVVTPPAAGP